jgi:hypothetical protein
VIRIAKQLGLQSTLNRPDLPGGYEKTPDPFSYPHPADYQTAIREIPRDSEIIELYKKLSGGDPLPNR